MDDATVHRSRLARQRARALTTAAWTVRRTPIFTFAHVKIGFRESVDGIYAPVVSPPAIGRR
jgi:hypothetical protein